MELVTCQHTLYWQHMALTHDRVFQMRATDEWLAKVDDWRSKQRPILPRAEAIRRLVEAGLLATN